MKQIYNKLLLKTAQQQTVDLNDSLCLYVYRAVTTKNVSKVITAITWAAEQKRREYTMHL